MSSLVGAMFAGVALGAAIPVIRPLVLSFGSPEFFMLSLLGISFVAALSGEDALKGLVAGGIGLMLATIGLDPISGIQRYTFGQLFLWDGIGLVPITIGFYAIPETIELAVLGTSISNKEVGEFGGVMEGRQRHLSPLLVGHALQRPRHGHGDYSGHGRGDDPVARLCPRRAKLAE